MQTLTIQLRMLYYGHRLDNLHREDRCSATKRYGFRLVVTATTLPRMLDRCSFASCRLLASSVRFNIDVSSTLDGAKRVAIGKQMLAKLGAY